VTRQQGASGATGQSQLRQVKASNNCSPSCSHVVRVGAVELRFPAQAGIQGSSLAYSLRWSHDSPGSSQPG
jgi:hypothetical protein